MLRSSNLDVLLLTPRATNAENYQIISALRKFGWALFGIMNTSHALCVTSAGRAT